ncbi:MAG: HupE/UreJ family protein [Desulfofustis sp.]|nr:HupE/UreJ family protein [Desulfofustis sp.]
MRSLIAIPMFLVVSSMAPRLALAHVPFAGLNDLYNGLLHPVVVPAHLLLLAAAGLLLGKQGSRAVPPSFLLFCLFTLTGLVATTFFAGGIGERYLLGVAAVIGLLIAANLRIPFILCFILAALTGFLLGFDSTQTVLVGDAKFFSLLGSGLGLCFLFLYPLAFADYFGDRNWQKIGVRIVGSWVAASAILVLALSLQPPSG